MTAEPNALREPPDLETELLDLVAEQLLDGDQSLEPSSSLAAAGLDSMAVMQLLLLIEGRYGLWLPEEDLTRENFACIRSLAAAVSRRLAARDGVL